MKLFNMFSNNSSVAVAEPEVVAPIEQELKAPSMVIPLEGLDTEDLDVLPEWLELNKELGITQRAPALYELKMFLREENLRIYQTQSVWDYMTEQYSTWKFFPLRDLDCARYPVGSLKNLHAEVRDWYRGTGHIGSQYSEKVPIPVLLTVKKIVEKFGDNVYFLVAATKEDPFLAVILRDSSLVFVERWDEPSFRG